MCYARIGTNATESAQSKFKMGAWAWNGAAYHVLKITNINDKEKLVTSETIKAESGAGNAPNRTEFTGKWINTSSSITSIQITSVASAGAQNVGDGSYITVWGINPAPVTSATITVDSLEAKKHLMVNYKLINDGSGLNSYTQFNADTGNNYAWRGSDNGGTDSTGTSTDRINDVVSVDPASQVIQCNYHIINEAAKEKLIEGSTNANNQNGAGNAPERREFTGKWSNTSNGITEIKITNTGGGDFSEGSEVTVYGTD